VAERRDRAQPRDDDAAFLQNSHGF
jgi:hypothetical protein